MNRYDAQFIFSPQIKSTAEYMVEALSHGLCKKHCALVFCSFGNCNTASVGKERSSKHGGQSKNECKIKDVLDRDTLAACSMWPLQQAWYVWDLHNQRMRHQRKLRNTALFQTRRKEDQAVLCSRLHHHVSTQGPLSCLCARHGGGLYKYIHIHVPPEVLYYARILF